MLIGVFISFKSCVFTYKKIIMISYFYIFSNYATFVFFLSNYDILINVFIILRSCVFSYKNEINFVFFNMQLLELF